MKRTIVTPLSKFPTEVILHFYRKNRLCHTDTHKYFVHYNWNKKCEECHKRFTKIDSKQDSILSWYDDCIYFGDKVNFRFEGLYWEGKIQDLKNELAKREHIGVFNNKDYRKWLINYRKNKKNGKLRRI